MTVLSDRGQHVTAGVDAVFHHVLRHDTRMTDAHAGWTDALQISLVPGPSHPNICRLQY